MKKLMLSAIAFTAMMCATAQNPITPVEAPNSDFKVTADYIIPRYFSYNNNTYLTVEHRTNSGWGFDSLFVYDKNLQLVKKLPRLLLDADNNEYAIGNIYYHDFDVDFKSSEANRILYTQTLFNNDVKFEYIVPVLDENREVSALQVVSDDGTIIYTFTFDVNVSQYDWSMDLIKIENRLYVYVSYKIGRDDNYNTLYKTDWYRIDRQTQSITRVENVPFNVFPTVAERGSDITVQLEEGTNAREIVVVDAMGREVKSVPVAQGQHEVKINTSDLGHGMGFVSDRKNGAVKIIVR